MVADDDRGALTKFWIPFSAGSGLARDYPGHDARSGTTDMKPLVLASAIAVLFAPTMLGAGHACAQPFGWSRAHNWAFHAPPRDFGYHGYGSPGFHPPAYAFLAYGRPSVAQPRFAARIPPGYDPERPSRSGWRRGERLPPDFRGDVVSDYARYHLRRPPRGYFWYRDADDYVLAAAGSGLIFEVINGD